MSFTSRGPSPNDGSRSSFGSYEIDWRSVFAGGGVQALIIGVLFYFDIIWPVYTVAIVAGGTVAAATSDNFQDEAIDAGLATAIGTALSLFSVLGAVYVGTRSLPVDLQADVVLAMALWGMFVVAVTGVVVGFAGAIVGFVVGRYRERWRLRKEYA